MLDNILNTLNTYRGLQINSCFPNQVWLVALISNKFSDNHRCGKFFERSHCSAVDVLISSTIGLIIGELHTTSEKK